MSQSLRRHLYEVAVCTGGLLSILFVAWISSSSGNRVNSAKPFVRASVEELAVTALREEFPSDADSEYRYFSVEADDGAGNKRKFVFRVKKSLVVDSMRCAIKEMVPW